MIFMVATFIVYIIASLYRRTGEEMNLLTLVLGICSIAAILTDETIKNDMIGLLTLFPIVFMVLQSIIKMIWRRT